MYALRRLGKKALFGTRTIDYHPAEITAKCTDSLASFTLSKLFKVHFDIKAMKLNKFKHSDDIAKVPRKEYDQHMVTFKKTNKAIGKHLNGEVLTCSIGTIAGVTLFGGTMVSADYINEIVCILSGFASGCTVILFVPELILKVYDRLRCLRASVLLRHYPIEHIHMNKSLIELHKANEELNIQYYKASCLGFWHTFGPILSALAAGMSAANSINSLHDNRNNMLFANLAMTYANAHFAAEGFDEWDRASRNIGYLDWKRNELIKQFKALDSSSNSNPELKKWGLIGQVEVEVEVDEKLVGH